MQTRRLASLWPMNTEAIVSTLFGTRTYLQLVHPTGPEILRVHVVSTPRRFVFSGGRSSRFVILTVSGLVAVQAGG